jgi:luciferase family oxidoreductase group 1
VSVPLSVLDLSPIGSGHTAADALAGTTRLARRADELGYHRFWVAEHHNIPSVASTAPDVLIAHLAASTERIRVGSGGVMLLNHAPLSVAERFGMLEALHPDRIDLGIGRAPGADMRTAVALGMATPERFPQHMTELRGYLGGGRGGLHAVAGPHTEPELWMLGSTDGGARIAAELGIPFCFAHHFHPHYTEPALQLYRDEFRPSATLAEPRVLVAAGVVVADDDDQAVRMAIPGGISMLRLREGRPGPAPTVEEAEAIYATLSPAEQGIVRESMERQIIGSPATVHAGLLDLIERTRTDELMLTFGPADPDLRIRGLEHVAAAFALAGAPVA